jgi:TonB family protein
MREGTIVVVGAGGSSVINDTLVRKVQGPLWSQGDIRFTIIIVVSILLHAGLVVFLRSVNLAPRRQLVLEEIPDRFARLIIEKPLPEKQTKTQSVSTGQNAADGSAEQESAEKTETSSDNAPATPTAARKRVAARTAQVEKKVRTVGVLGMLTGAGKTAKGPGVVDVLGGVEGGTERFQDLDKALDNMKGLVKAEDIQTVQKKLVKSKDVSVNHKEAIDDLIAGIEKAKATTLTKKGDFVIQRPESIEGAASSHAKRDNTAINEVVVRHKRSVRMSYEKFLKRNPDLQGKITIRFTIAASGRISAVEVLENTTNDASLERELIRKIRMWRFEEIPDGEVTVTYPFVFQPA